MKYCKNCGKGAVHDDWVKKCVICKGTEFIHDDWKPTAQQLADIESRKPKCPTCGSTNIRRITVSERAGNAIMWGLFGNKRKCQFECLNSQCKYRW